MFSLETDWAYSDNHSACTGQSICLCIGKPDRLGVHLCSQYRSDKMRNKLVVKPEKEVSVSCQ